MTEKADGQRREDLYEAGREGIREEGVERSCSEEGADEGCKLLDSYTLQSIGASTDHFSSPRISIVP